jgi:hypothetical protein
MGNIGFGFRLSTNGRLVEPDPAEQAALGALGELGDEGFQTDISKNIRSAPARLLSHRKKA